MAAAILDQGKTAIRESLKALVSHVAVSDDNTAFSSTQTGINPNATGTSTHVEAATDSDVDANTFDATITITGSSEFTDKSIYAIGVAQGLGVRSATGSGGTHTGGGTVGTDLLTRAVRTLPIGVQSGDTFTLGVRLQVQDNS
jgi:uncharacterized protein (UPF0261 family)